MKPDNLLRAASAILLFSLNIIGGLLFNVIGDLKTDVRTLNNQIRDVQIRLYGAELNITTLQKQASNSQIVGSR